MTSSNFLVWLTFVLGMMAMMACSKHSPTITGNDGATFYVDSITETVSADQLNSNQVVNRKFINFTACVKDNAQQAAIMHLAFQIKAGSVGVTKQTDERGCLVWQELFEFDPFDNEKQVLMTRTITAQQGHSGHEDVKLAYDPWSSGDNMAFLKREAAQGAEAIPITYTAGGTIQRVDAFSKQTFLTPVDIHGTLTSQEQKKTDVTNLSLTFLNRDFDNYEIDPLLYLSIAHKYRFKFTASMIRQTLTQGDTLQNIGAGKFKFYLVLLDENYSDPKGIEPHIVSATTFEAPANLGRFIADVTLKFDHVEALASRMTGVLTLASEDQPNGFAEMSFTGLVTPISGGANQGIDLVPTTDLDGHKLYDKSVAFKKVSQSQRALAKFAAVPGNLLMKPKTFTISLPVGPRCPNQPTGLWQRLTQGYCLEAQSNALMYEKEQQQSYNLYERFKKMRDGIGRQIQDSEKEAFGQALCIQYFDEAFIDYATNSTLQAAFKACHENPQDMLDGEYREFVEDLVSSKPDAIPGPSNQDALKIATNLTFRSDSQREDGDKKDFDYGWNFGVSASGSFGTPSAPGLFSGSGIGVSAGWKLNASHNWYTTTGLSRNLDSSTSESATTHEIDVNSESFAFIVHVKSRSCYLIRPNDKLVAQFGKIAYPKVRYFCGDEVGVRNVAETYYFINQNTALAGSPLSDGMSAQDNPFRMFVRGKQVYNLFAKLFANPNYSLNLTEVPDSAALEDQFKGFYINQEFEGMLSPEDNNSQNVSPGSQLVH